MNWTEEKYVKLYVRDTPTWRAWPWQAKALWPLLLRKLDGAGLLEIGRLQPAHAVSLMTELPTEVVEVALKALEDDETLVRVESGYLAPKFLEAQEARKSDALRASESRARRRNDAKSGAPASHGVTRRHETSQPVTLQPSPAQPSPAVKDSAGEKPPAPPKPEKPADLRHAPLVKALVEAGCDFRGGIDAKQVTLLLAKGSPEEVLRRWRRALDWPLPFPRVRTLTELVGMWSHFAADATPRGVVPPAAPSTQEHQTRLVENF